MRTFVAATDFHGDRHDPTAVRVLEKFLSEFKPVTRFFMGDLWDLRAIREGASKGEKLHSLRRDYEAGMKFLEMFRPNVITLGNHDARLYDLIRKDGIKKSGPLTDLARLFVDRFESTAKKMGAIILPYDKRKGVYRDGGLAVAHGISTGKDATTEMARLYGNVIFGHIHAFDVATEPDHRTPRVARSSGCLCDLNATYNRTHGSTLRQQHGFLYGGFHGRGHTVFPAVIEHGQVVYAEHLKQLSA